MLLFNINKITKSKASATEFILAAFHVTSIESWIKIISIIILWNAPLEQYYGLNAAPDTDHQSGQWALEMARVSFTSYPFAWSPDNICLWQRFERFQDRTFEFVITEIIFILIYIDINRLLQRIKITAVYYSFHLYWFIILKNSE